MKIKIKICGVLDHHIMSTISDLNVDYVGLVFFEKSPRNISIDKAKLIVKYIGNSTKIVALTGGIGSGKTFVSSMCFLSIRVFSFTPVIELRSARTSFRISLHFCLCFMLFFYFAYRAFGQWSYLSIYRKFIRG